MERILTLSSSGMDEECEKLQRKVKELREYVKNDQKFTKSITEQLELRKPSRPRGSCWCCFTVIKLCWISFLLLIILGLAVYCYRPAGDLFMKHVVNNIHLFTIPMRYHYVNLVLPYIGEWWGIFSTGCLINVPTDDQCICRYSKPKLKHSLREGLHDNELYILENALDEDSVLDVWHLLEYSDVPPFVCLESCSHTNDNCVDNLFTGELVRDNEPWTVTWQVIKHTKDIYEIIVISFRQECTETTSSYHILTPNLDFFLKEWSQKYLLTVSNQWGASSHLQVLWHTIDIEPV